MIGSITRVALWASGTALSALAIGGTEALAQPVEVPLWLFAAILILPTKAFTDLFRRLVERVQVPEERNGD